jgi:hypothetical protein
MCKKKDFCCVTLYKIICQYRKQKTCLNISATGHIQSVWLVLYISEHTDVFHHRNVNCLHVEFGHRPIDFAEGSSLINFLFNLLFIHCKIKEILINIFQSSMQNGIISNNEYLAAIYVHRHQSNMRNCKEFNLKTGATLHFCYWLI